LTVIQAARLRSSIVGLPFSVFRWVSEELPGLGRSLRSLDAGLYFTVAERVCMLPYQKLIYPCAFCDKETLGVIYRPSYKAAKRSQSAAAGSKITWRRVGEGIILLSEKCSNCGKSVYT
jgi:MoaA/NifB/PqqE/SkfB family radical SAM enzyme